MLPRHDRRGPRASPSRRPSEASSGTLPFEITPRRTRDGTGLEALVLRRNASVLSVPSSSPARRAHGGLRRARIRVRRLQHAAGERAWTARRRRTTDTRDGARERGDRGRSRRWCVRVRRLDDSGRLFRPPAAVQRPEEALRRGVRQHGRRGLRMRRPHLRSLCAGERRRGVQQWRMRDRGLRAGMGRLQRHGGRRLRDGPLVARELRGLWSGVSGKRAERRRLLRGGRLHAPVRGRIRRLQRRPFGRVREEPPQGQAKLRAVRSRLPDR